MLLLSTWLSLALATAAEDCLCHASSFHGYRSLRQRPAAEELSLPYFLKPLSSPDAAAETRLRHHLRLLRRLLRCVLLLPLRSADPLRAATAARLHASCCCGYGSIRRRMLRLPLRLHYLRRFPPNDPFPLPDTATAP